jgi:DNA polymerase-3 subunit epsilon
VAGDIGVRLSDSIVVGHHLRFDLGFLASEFSRFGVTLPAFPSLCTLDLTYKLLPEIPSRKLAQCCEAAGIRHEQEHSALGDARATAALLAHYLECARQSGLDRLISERVENMPLPQPNWLPHRPSGRKFCRQLAAKHQTEERRYLARLVERMLGDEAIDSSSAEYLLLLDRALEDRLVSRSEAETLVSAASTWGMKRSKVLDAHRAYLTSLASEALADGVVTNAERRDLESVCDMLDLNYAALDEALATSQTRAPFQSDNLNSKTVCFTGELVGIVDGNRITRDMAGELAIAAGLELQASVTRHLDILVVADSNTQSGKAKKAREYGVRIMAEATFWKAIHARVD